MLLPPDAAAEPPDAVAEPPDAVAEPPDAVPEPPVAVPPVLAPPDVAAPPRVPTLPPTFGSVLVAPPLAFAPPTAPLPLPRVLPQPTTMTTQRLVVITRRIMTQVDHEACRFTRSELTSSRIRARRESTLGSHAGVLRWDDTGIRVGSAIAAAHRSINSRCSRA